MNSRPDPAAAALRPVAKPAPVARLASAGLGDWEQLVAQARMLVASGFLPKEVNTPEKAVAIALTGQELGIPVMLALRSIYIINAKPVLSADLMASLVLREIDRHGDGLLQPLPPTAEAATVRYRRWGAKAVHEYTFTIADAQRAGLAGRETWKAYPAAMLRARAVATVCRMAFPDVCAGLYVADELLGTADEDGGWAPGPEGLDPDAHPLIPEVVEADSAEGLDWADVADTREPVTGDDDPAISLLVDPGTGEAPAWQAMDMDQASAAVLRLREALGWTQEDVKTHAREHRISMLSAAGRASMAAALYTMVREELGMAVAKEALLGNG